MKKKRLIPVVLYKDGFIVQGRQFKEYLNIGNATDSIKRYSEWAADELIYLNIGENKNDMRREDANFENRQDFLDIIKIVCKNAFMPIAVGGKIDNINYARKLFKNGADKIVINSSFVKEPNILEKFSKEFGAQSIVVSLDFKLIKRQYEIFYNNGKTKSLINQKEIFSKINKYSGEVLLNSVDYDGMGNGFDYKLVNRMKKNIFKPIIICGGAGKFSDFYKAFKIKNIDGVAAANYFQYKDQSFYNVKKYLFDKKINIRRPELIDF